MGGGSGRWGAGVRGIALAVVAGVGSGCGTATDVEEIRTTQREILQRLATLERNDQALLTSLRSGAIPGLHDSERSYDIALGASPAAGSPGAPVTIVQFLDFQCPFSRSALGVIDEVRAAYGENVRLVIKQFPLVQLHRDARIAAKAALAAHRQGKYWEMHERLFEHQHELGYESLIEHAAAIGLDVTRFESDMAAAELEAELRADIAAGRKARVMGTPSFFVNGVRVATRTFDTFKTMIDDVLAAHAATS